LRCELVEERLFVMMVEFAIEKRIERFIWRKWS
jgi:hypothetical protein